MFIDYDDASIWHGLLVCEGDTIPLQFTGLHDKNGKEIYDSDLVKIEDEVYRVVWGYFEDCCVSGETWILEGIGYQPTVQWRADDLVVIGNIYENPDLISSEEKV